MTKCLKLTIYFLVLYLYLKPISAECIKCQNNINNTKLFDMDQTVIYHDYGLEGMSGPLNVTLPNTLQPGAIINVVASSEIRGTINLISDDIFVLHLDARIQLTEVKNNLIINTSKNRVDWRPDEVAFPNPVIRGAKTTKTIIFEAEGYRIFINGKEITCYEHRTSKEPRVLQISEDRIYKVLISTTTK